MKVLEAYSTRRLRFATSLLTLITIQLCSLTGEEIPNA